MLVHRDREYVDANPAACRLFGRKREEIVGRRLGDFSSEERRRSIDGLVERLRVEGHLFMGWSLPSPDGAPERAMNATVVADVPEPGLDLVIFLSPDEEDRATPAAGRPDARLSPRELEVTGMLARGLTGEEIARALVLSPETVRT